MTKTEIVLAALGLKIAVHRGRRAWIPCPFHATESTTTFFVRTSGERAGNYWCFSCKAKGGLVALTMHVRGLEIEKARSFVEDAGRGWRAPEARVRFVSLPAVLVRRGFVLPSEVVRAPLAAWDTLPRRYAVERGITALDVDAHGIGFAVDGPLAGRIIFPVQSEPGKIVGYSARTFVDAEPRYKTPREDERADLDAIFGEHLWPPLGERDLIVVTEGAIDNLAVVRATGHVVGSLGGSDVRSGHVITLATFRRVVILTDVDEAGDAAARTLRSRLGRHVLTSRAVLPPKTDAAILALRDPELLRRRIDRAIDGFAS